jgi:peptidoglycan/xylan/chitin deacetylase (PgdA/CDA1 family)
MGRDVLVLCYHAISEQWPAALSSTPEQFEAHLSVLTRRGYRGVTFHEAVREPVAKRAVAITFDDGYRSVLDLARPVLEHYNMPATVFVPTALVGIERPMSWDGIDHWLGSEHESELVPMSWDDLGELASAGWEIGSHTRTHPRLTLLDDRGVRHELEGSRRDCERALGLPCRSLAYPFGDHDERVVRLAERAGFSAGGALPKGFPRSPNALAYPRVGVYHRDHSARFRLKASALVRRLRATPAWSALGAA